MGLDLMGMKSKILEEILEDLNDQQGSGLKPKAAISVTAVKPEVDGMDLGHDDSDPLTAMGSSPGGDPMSGGDDDDDVLKKLLEEYGISK